MVDCLRDNENGLLVEAGDIAAQVSGLDQLVRDTALRERLANAALEECQLVYSWHTVAGQIMAIYQELAGTRPDTGFESTLPVTECRFRHEPHLL